MVTHGDDLRMITTLDGDLDHPLGASEKHTVVVPEIRNHEAQLQSQKCVDPPSNNQEKKASPSPKVNIDNAMGQALEDWFPQNMHCFG